MRLPIVSSNALATALAKGANGRIAGFIVEYPVAGGHNAPPRGRANYNDAGEPIYTDKDDVDLDKLKALGLTFWLAGGFGQPGRLQAALACGAAGVQVETPLAYCDESGMEPALRQQVLDKVRSGNVQVRTDRADTEGVVCLCNSLGATAGYPRHRKNGYVELPLVTAASTSRMWPAAR